MSSTVTNNNADAHDTHNSNSSSRIKAPTHPHTPHTSLVPFKQPAACKQEPIDSKHRHAAVCGMEPPQHVCQCCCATQPLHPPHIPHPVVVVQVAQAVILLARASNRCSQLASIGQGVAHFGQVPGMVRCRRQLKIASCRRRCHGARNWTHTQRTRIQEHTAGHTGAQKPHNRHTQPTSAQDGDKSERFHGVGTVKGAGTMECEVDTSAGLACNLCQKDWSKRS